MIIFDGALGLVRVLLAVKDVETELSLETEVSLGSAWAGKNEIDPASCKWDVRYQRPSCNPRQAAEETAAGIGKLLCLCLEKIRKVHQRLHRFKQLMLP